MNRNGNYDRIYPFTQNFLSSSLKPLHSKSSENNWLKIKTSSTLIHTLSLGTTEITFQAKDFRSVIFILFQNPEISSKLAEFNSKSFKSEDSQKAKTNKSWKTSFWANSMEFSKPLKRSRGLVKFVSVMTTRKRISSFLHASVKAHVLSFTLNALNNGSTVKLKRKLWELSKHTTLTNSSVKSANILTHEWL
jgi:hypothetical protein